MTSEPEFLEKPWKVTLKLWHAQYWANVEQILSHVMTVSEEFRMFFFFLWYCYELYYICKFILNKL